MTDKPDLIADALAKLKAPWTLRLGWKLNKGGIMAWVLAFLDKYLGKNWKRIFFGVAAAVSIVLEILHNLMPAAFGWADTAVKWIASAVTFTGAGTGAPADWAQLVAGVVSAVLAVVALVQPILRWATSNDAPKQ